MNQRITKDSALSAIATNIQTYGHDIYIVAGGQSPRFAYTIGLYETVGCELIFAGGIYFMKDDVLKILNRVARSVSSNSSTRRVEVEGLGGFSLDPVHSTWSSRLLLGALDFFKIVEIPTFQVVPDPEYSTIDVPQMRQNWSEQTAPAWRWLFEPWRYPVPEDSTVVTNLAALRGSLITEVARWEPDQWEAFSGSGPETPTEEVRVVPIGTLLGFDSSLEPMINMAVNEAMWRDRGSDWQPWTKRKA